MDKPLHAPSRREVKPFRASDPDSTALNELNYDVRFEGRQNEIDTLQGCLNRILEGKDAGRRKELVFIRGYSGTGKSTLAYTLNKQASQIPNAIFAHGKFNSNNNDEPYSGVAGVFSEIALALETNSKFQEDRNESFVIESASSEMELLKNVVPEMERLIPTERVMAASEMESFSFEAGLERWKYAFRKLTRLFSSYFSPLILVLDDLQWADASSLAVLDYLISDTQNESPLMVVGCYRSNEVDDTHILSSKILSLSSKKRNYGFNMTVIELDSLEVTDANKIIMSMLSIGDEKRTEGLAEICLKRTLGNPLFLIQFVSMLKEEGLLMCDMITLEWSWDCQAIDESTMSTANVVDLLGSRMRKLPEDAQLLLQYASYLGSSFSPKTLQIIWKEHGKATLSGESKEIESNSQDLSSLLEMLEHKDFIENRGNYEYRWVHDKVQEAASSLGISLQFEIGSILYHSLSREALEDSVFDVVDLINQGDTEQRSEFIELYLLAGRKARSVSAFQSAVGYVSVGIELLPPSKWETHRDLTLGLYTLGAELKLAVGGYDEMEEYSNEVLNRGDCSTLEKTPLYITKLNKLSSVDVKHEESMEFGLHILKEFGCDLVFRKGTIAVQSLISLLRTIRMAKKKGNEVKNKHMVDPKDVFIMQLLYRVAMAAYFCDNDDILVLSIAVMVQRTIKQGANEMGGIAYGLLGLMAIGGLGDFAGGRDFAETSLMLEQLKGSVTYSTGATEMTAFCFLLPWTRSLLSCFLESVHIHQRCMLAGNVEMAMWCLLNRDLLIPFHMGTPISPALEKCKSCLSQAEEFKQEDQCILIKVLRKLYLHLTRPVNSPDRLKGEVFDRSSLGELSSKVHLATANSFDIILLNFFGDYDLAADMSIEAGDSYAQNVPADHIIMMETFHRGLALYAMASKTRNRKYTKRAKRILNTIKGWIKKGNPNVNHYFAFLSAEQAVIDKDYMKADLMYQDAISIAAKSGYLHVAGLCNERYESFLRREDMAKEDEASFRREEAIRYYELWGATAKVHEMKMRQNLVARELPEA